jgi:hypothetical protein
LLPTPACYLLCRHTHTMYIHTYTHTHNNIYIHTHTHTHTHTYTHVHTYIHTYGHGYQRRSQFVGRRDQQREPNLLFWAQPPQAREEVRAIWVLSLCLCVCVCVRACVYARARTHTRSLPAQDPKARTCFTMFYYRLCLNYVRQDIMFYKKLFFLFCLIIS